MELMTAKGMTDFPPELMIGRQKLLNKLRSIFERYGYAPLETPLVERFDVLASKYSGGSEILKETFKLTDQGGRELALRYDLTVPLCRFVGQNPSMKMPFKRYAIGRVYRDGPIKAGRMREFWQCDVDVVGVESMIADAECIKIAQDAFIDLGIPAIIEFSNRKFLDGLMAYLEIPEEKRVAVITAIDKMKKIPLEDVKAEIANQGIDADKVIDTIRVEGTNQEIIARYKELNTDVLAEGIAEIEGILAYVNDRKGARVVFAPTLARGLAYYTGTVFEVFSEEGLRSGKFTSSLAGGGRYDNMIGDFLGGAKKFPAVGISFGIEPISVVLGMGVAKAKTLTQVYVIPLETEIACAALCDELRAAGLNVDMDMNARSISKNLDYADKLKIPYALIVGENEIAAGTYQLKDMQSGDKQDLKVQDIIKIINDK